VGEANDLEDGVEVERDDRLEGNLDAKCNVNFEDAGNRDTELEQCGNMSSNLSDQLKDIGDVGANEDLDGGIEKDLDGDEDRLGERLDMSKSWRTRKTYSTGVNNDFGCYANSHSRAVKLNESVNVKVKGDDSLDLNHNFGNESLNLRQESSDNLDG
jgi:hypothetical protein